MNVTVSRLWHTPLFSAVLEDRLEVFVIVGAGALHLGLNLMGLPGWSCPILAVTGVPCPGCGLTRATMELLHGQFVQSFHTHAFAPIFLSALMVMLITLILPEAQRRKVIAIVSNLETRNGITAWVLSLLMLYWAFRLIA